MIVLSPSPRLLSVIWLILPHTVWVLMSLHVAPSCAVLHIKPGKSLAESLQSEPTSQGSADHSISSVLLVRKHRKQHLGDFLHRCAGINSPKLPYRMQFWAFHVHLCSVLEAGC